MKIKITNLDVIVDVNLNTHRRSCFVKKTPDTKELFKDTREEIDVTRNGNSEIIDIITGIHKRFIKRSNLTK